MLPITSFMVALDVYLARTRQSVYDVAVLTGVKAERVLNWRIGASRPTSAQKHIFEALWTSPDHQTS